MGAGAGRAVLDSVRVARALDDDLDAADRYVVRGHSQGGHAALFAGALAADGYAPELSLAGVGALAPATDLGDLLAAAQGTRGGLVLTAQAVESWSRVYPELSFEEGVARRAQRVTRSLARRCITFPAYYVAAAQALLLPDRILAIDVTRDPRWVRRLSENTPAGAIEAPVLVGQGRDDGIVSARVSRAHVARRCAEGVGIDLREYDGGHLDIIEAAGADLLAWTAGRLADEPVPAGCAAPDDPRPVAAGRSIDE